jgi:hypothetical protein
MIATLGAAAFAVQERMAWRDSRGGIERRRRRHLDARRRRACGGLSERSWPCGCGCWALGPGCWKTVGLDRPVAACNTSAGHSAIHGHDHGVNMFRPGSIPRERLRSRFLGHRGGPPNAGDRVAPEGAGGRGLLHVRSHGRATVGGRPWNYGCACFWVGGRLGSAFAPRY